MIDPVDLIKKLTAPMQRRISNMLARGVIKNVDDSGNLQAQQVEMLKDELADGMPMVGQYGLASNPLAGAEALVAFLAGNRSHGIVVGTEDRRYRLKNLEPGEVALYNHEGCKVIWRNGKKLEISNTSEELVTVLSDALAWLLAARVLTALGPQQFIETDRETLQLIKDRLDTFKV